jgi:hypothetical protein
MGINFVGPFPPFGTKDLQKVWILVMSCTLTRAMILCPVQGFDLKTFCHTFNTLCYNYDLQHEVVVSDQPENFQAAYTCLLWLHLHHLNDPEYAGSRSKVKWFFNTPSACGGAGSTSNGAYHQE